MKKLLEMADLVLLAVFLAFFIMPWRRSSFVQRIYVNAVEIVWKYTLFVPVEYTGDRSYPLLVYLQGSGARHRRHETNDRWTGAVYQR